MSVIFTSASTVHLLSPGILSRRRHAADAAAAKSVSFKYAPNGMVKWKAKFDVHNGKKFIDELRHKASGNAELLSILNGYSEKSLFSFYKKETIFGNLKVK